MPAVSISLGNSKMGNIPSVSLPPVTTCPAGAPCAKLCYAARMCRQRPNVAAAYQRNLDAYKEDPRSYFLQISAAMAVSRFFRFHVAGDIPDYEYLAGMVDVCRQNPHCKALCFTKRYSLVNVFASDNCMPENLQIVFSEWGDAPIENPTICPPPPLYSRAKNPGETGKFVAETARNVHPVGLAVGS